LHIKTGKEGMNPLFIINFFVGTLFAFNIEQQIILEEETGLVQ